MKKYLKIMLLFLIGFLGGVAGTLTISLFYTPKSSPEQITSTVTKQATVNYTNQTSTTEAVKQVQDAVVSVINYQQANSQSNPFRSLVQSDGWVVASEGSGVIYKKDAQTAYIVTNTHVIAGAEKIDIQLASGEKVEGTLVGSDTFSDIAVIKIAADKVKKVAEFADSDSITIGEVAIAIGSPLGSKYANSVTQGIISSLSRTVLSESEDGQTVMTNAIQTDTAINPGNSGGPLINIQGQVIGITSSKIASTSRSSYGISVEGMGFAIPTNDATAIIQQLEEHGKVIRPALGIQMANVAELSSNQLQTAGLEGEDITSGVLVLSTQPGLPADGNFEKYDVIVAIGENTIESSSDLQSALYKHQIGEDITITYYRKGQKKTVSLKLTHSTEDLAQ